MARRRKSRRSGGRGRSGPLVEWIGGRVAVPVQLSGPDQPDSVEFVAWVSSQGLIVGHELVASEEADGALGRALLVALDQPYEKRESLPGVIRVAGRALADEVRAALSDPIPIVIAPTPEIGAVVDSFLEFMSGTAATASYFAGGHITPDTVAELFISAERLFHEAPWKVAQDGQVLKMDIPSLDVEGACLSIIGNLGESLGVVVFASLADYEAFVLTTGEQDPEAGSVLDLGVGWLSLNFDSAEILPGSMMREVQDHGWPVAALTPIRMFCVSDGMVPCNRSRRATWQSPRLCAVFDPLLCRSPESVPRRVGGACRRDLQFSRSRV